MKRSRNCKVMKIFRRRRRQKRVPSPVPYSKKNVPSQTNVIFFTQILQNFT